MFTVYNINKQLFVKKYKETIFLKKSGKLCHCLHKTIYRGRFVPKGAISFIVLFAFEEVNVSISNRTCTS